MDKCFVNLTAGILLGACASSPVQAAKPSGGGGTVERHPILFVHGYMSGGYVWDTMISRFKQDGWTDSELYSWSYNYNQSNATTAQEVSRQVDQILAATGASKVDIISHSMGGLSSRHYAKFLGGDSRIDGWVSLAGPNHGTDFAYGCLSTSCFEMRPGSSFLFNLNAGDETPGNVRYATFWSPCDDIINPDSSVALKGATNTKTACISHNWFLEDETVYRQARDFVNR